MTRLGAGLIAGLVFGLVAVGLMLPMQFPDKRAALTGAFLSRFAIGVLTGVALGSPDVAALGLPTWGIGLCVGLLVSAPDAAVTKAYAPILGLGALGGALIGWIVGRVGA